jgi:hypothetical protein
MHASFPCLSPVLQLWAFPLVKRVLKAYLGVPAVLGLEELQCHLPIDLCD